MHAHTALNGVFLAGTIVRNFAPATQIDDALDHVVFLFAAGFAEDTASVLKTGVKRTIRILAEQGVIASS